MKTAHRLRRVLMDAVFGFPGADPPKEVTHKRHGQEDWRAGFYVDVDGERYYVVAFHREKGAPWRK